MKLLDSLVNLVAGLGTERDKASHDSFALAPLSEPALDAMFHGNWVANKIVRLPVVDTFRAWRVWQVSADAATAFEAAERRHGVRTKLARAVLLSRLYGGAAIIVGADVADPLQPLNLRSVKKGGLAYLTVVPRRSITAGPPDRDPRSPGYLSPAWYEIATAAGGSTRLHPSRVIRFVGAERFDLAGESDGWGYSALQAPYDAVHHAALAAGASASMLHEAKVDVIRLDGLEAALAAPEGTAALQKRFSLVSMMKGINGTLLLSKNDEWHRAQTSFSGVPQLLERFLAVAAAAADIPAARFLSQSASGLNASGDADMRNYYDRLAGERADVLAPALERLDAVLWLDATGAPAPRGATYSWDSLWQPTEKERTDTGKVLADTVSTLVNTALIPEEALREGVQNALIESGVFPGLEAALARASVAVDPLGEDDPEPPIAAPRDVAPGHTKPSGRERIAALAREARARRLAGGAITHH